MRLFSTLASVMLLFATLQAQVPNYVPTDGLVGWWPFNGNANDESGNGNDGTVNGATLTADRFGNAGSAYQFDGIDDIITFSNLNVISNNWSVSFWFNAQNTNIFEYQGVIGFGTPISSFGGPGFLINGGIAPNQCPLPPDNLNKMLIADATSECQQVIFSDNYVADFWYFVVIVRNNNNYSTYINGELTTSGNLTNIPLSQLIIGNRSNLNFQFFNGYVDDVGAWNRSLTEAEIGALYNGQPLSPCISTTPVSFIGLNTSYLTSDSPVVLFGTPVDGVFIGPGISGSTFLPSVAGEGTHSISYTYLDGDNCVNTYSLCTSVALGMGVEPGTDALGGVRVFPNPNRGQFTVELALSGLVSLQVFDARGVLVHNEVFTASGTRTQRSLDLSTMARGSYTLLVENNGGRVSQRVVVE